jgi:acyl-coenzyme A synthetase/AMP-(fatty) acid ligase
MEVSLAGDGAPPVPPAAMNLAAQVLAAGQATPDKVALVIARAAGAERWSFARLTAAVRGVAGGLLARGLCPGDRVLLRLPDGPEVPVAFLGAIAAGLVPVPTQAALTAAEATALAARLHPKLVIGGGGIALPDHPAPVADLAALRAMQAGPPADWHMGDPDRPAYVQATSGTTGRPSLVVHAHRVILGRAMMRDGWQGLGPADRVMHAGAMGWSYTLGVGMLDPWAAGATAVLPAPGTDLAQLPLLARRHDVTILAATPGHFRRLLRLDLPPLPRLRHALSAGEALPPALRRAWSAATGTDLHEALGMTEVSTWLSGSPARPAPEGATGWPQAGRRMAILGADGTPLPRGETGEIAIAATDPGLALGYLDDPAGWQARLADGWFRTGDLGCMAPDGSVTFRGRADDLLNPGGHRISPLEVEAAFDGVPGLESCAATAAEVAPGTFVLALAYVAPDDLAEMLAARAAERLAPWKLPRLWHRMVALPVTRTGKLDRRALAALLQAAMPATN